MADTLTEYELEREERLAKNRAVLAALSIPSSAAATRDGSPEEAGDASRRRRRDGASASAPSRRSTRAEARKVRSYADGEEKDSDGESGDASDSDSDSRKKNSEVYDSDFEATDGEDAASSDERDSDAEIVEGVGGVSERGTGCSERNARRTNVSKKKRRDERLLGPTTAAPFSANATARDGATSDVPKEKKAKSKEKKPDASRGFTNPKTFEETNETHLSDVCEDARVAFVAFLAPSAAVALRRGKLELRSASFGLRELRAAADAHGFEDWTDEDLMHMLAPEIVGDGTNCGDGETAGFGVCGTDLDAAESLRRAAAAAAAANVRLGVADLARVVEKVGAKRTAT
jgi:hypothetical protein